MEFNQESNDKKMDENKEDATEETSTNNAKQWFQDNLRIIISVAIVVLIAGGIYSYSKRSQAPTVSQDSGAVAEGTTDNNGAATDQANTTPTAPATDSGTATQEKSTPAATSQETQGAFVETAVAGDSMTKLARKALADYLEKNPDSALTAEHKIYIEDYLRKNVTQKKVSVGTSVEFSKDLIATSIAKSKTLSPQQLQNLHKYALRVPSLS